MREDPHVIAYGDEFVHEALSELRFALAADLFDEIDAPEPAT